MPEKDRNMMTRAISVEMSDGAPSTLNDKEKSVTAIMTTEAPVMIYDWDHGRINEILLMKGAKFGSDVPLYDNHYTWEGTMGVIGKVVDISIDGDAMEGKVIWDAGDPNAMDRYGKLARGFVTKFSVGYRIDRENGTVFIPEGQTGIVEGKEYSGPVVVRTSWELMELSQTANPADKNAQAKSKDFNNNDNRRGDMDPKLLEFLYSLGMKRDANNAEIEDFMREIKTNQANRNLIDLAKGKHDGASDSAKFDYDAIRSAIDDAVKPFKEKIEDIETRMEESADMEKKTERANNIRGLCESYGMKSDEISALIESGETYDKIRGDVLAKFLEERDGENVRYFGEISVGREQRDINKDLMTDVILMRSGRDLKDKEVNPKVHDLMSYNSVSLARECLHMSGQSLRGTDNEIVTRAMTTSDFPVILQNALNKVVWMGWDEQAPTWNRWCGTGSVRDFRQSPIISKGFVGRLSDMDEAEKGYPYTDFAEHEEYVKVSKKGRKLRITRETIVNDDLNLILAGAQDIGNAASRSVEHSVYAYLASNPTMSDGVALFHASHGNIATSYVGGISEESLDEMEEAMGDQKDWSDQEELALEPRYIIGPRSIKMKSEKFFKSEQWLAEAVAGTPDEAVAATRGNVYFNADLERIWTSRLKSYSTTAWYGASDRGTGINVYYLNGQTSPYVNQTLTENRDIEILVEFDWGVAAVDYRGLFYNAGA